jgi:hypothetical protein
MAGGAGAGGDAISSDTGESGADSTSAAAGEAGAGTEDPDAAIVTVPTDGAVLSLDGSPLTLTPAFSPTIDDYYVRCAEGGNTLTLTLSTSTGPSSATVTVAPDQAIVVGGTYWIRCLPPDFPIVTVAQPGTPTPGYYLLNSLTYGAVFDVHGVPVWYTRGTSPINIESPRVNALSLMPNAVPTATITSSYEIRDLAANTRTTIAAPDALTDEHELRVLANGDFLIFAQPIETGVDLSGFESYTANTALLDCKIEELDASGNLVWSWLASDHIDPKLESLFAPDPVVNGITVADVFHCNGIDVDSSGNLLVSIRHTNAVFYIDRSSGQILWKLNGTAYSKDGAALVRIQDDPQTSFSLQHDARFQANGDVTLYDDHGLGTGAARAIEYSIDLGTNTATPVFESAGAGTAQYEGSFRRYSDGDSIIGWGYIPGDLRVLTEIDASGNNVFDISFSGPGNQSYRAVKVPLSQFDIGLLRQNTAK